MASKDFSDSPALAYISGAGTKPVRLGTDSKTRVAKTGESLKSEVTEKETTKKRRPKTSVGLPTGSKAEAQPDVNVGHNETSIKSVEQQQGVGETNLLRRGKATRLTNVAGIKLHTLDEIAELLHVSPRSIHNYIKRGQLIGRKIGGCVYVSEENFKKYLNGEWS